ncbi:hypothetical protein F5884DRAFT_464775 [Xylogone sp. PMI_703]|nr:hypothetical protein F5884DRAFT_464775 [Xylogone sp. PMI_703]
MVRRNLNKLLRCSDCVVRNAIASTHAQKRTFKSSATQLKNALPTFSPSSSPELDAILNSFRTKILLPSHLSRAHQQLISRDRNRELLKSDSVTVDIGGEEFRLEHIDVTKDVPNTRRALFSAIELMQTKSDWDNLPLILQGLNGANRKLKPKDAAKIVRKACLAGRHDVALECARRVGTTGFSLHDPEIVTELMWQLQKKAADANWSEKQTKQALAWAEMVADLLEDPRHAGSRTVSETDPRILPDVIGVLLQLAAVRASRHLDGKDEDDKVAKYAERLSATDLEMLPRVSSHEANYRLAALVPLLHAMKTTLTVLPDSATSVQKLKSKIPEIERLVSELRASEKAREVKGNKPRGLEIYDLIFGSEST